MAANWFAGQDVHESYYGLPLRLAADARRFDISPAWHCWVGTAPALRVLSEVGVDAINAHDVGLANSFLAAMDQPPSNSAIVSVPADEAAVARLHAAGVRFGMRAGRVRVALPSVLDRRTTSSWRCGRCAAEPAAQPSNS